MPDTEWSEKEMTANAAALMSGAETLQTPDPTRHCHRSQYHSPAGKCGKAFLFSALAWMLLAVPAGSFLYALANFFIPYPAVVVAALFAFAAGNGCGITLLARWCGCRSPRTRLLAAFTSGVWSAYLAWVGWVWILNDFWSLGLIFDPFRLGRVIGFLAADGVRGMGSRIVSTWEWYTYWAFEMLVMILVPAVIVRGRHPGKPRGNR